MSEKPPCFPMMFTEFLRRAIGGRLYADRMRIFRRYWDEVLKTYESTSGLTAERREKMRDDTVKMLIRDGVSQDIYEANIEVIATWRRRVMVRQRVNAANARWHPKATQMDGLTSESKAKVKRRISKSAVSHTKKP